MNAWSKTLATEVAPHGAREHGDPNVVTPGADVVRADFRMAFGIYFSSQTFSAAGTLVRNSPIPNASVPGLRTRISF
jgi:hypothetical protein